MDESRRYKIGYLLAPKKKQSFIRPSLVNQSRERGIDLVEIDQSIPLLNQGPFDCVLHKCYSEDWKLNLLTYSIEHPGIPIIDYFSSIVPLHNRITMLQFVTGLQIPQENDTFGIPNQVVVHNSNSLVDSSNELKFPVIAKPLVADGSAKSHKMELVYNKDGLLKLKPPIVLQEFVNHGGVVFKVYVVGDYVKCVRRKSLPDVCEKLENLEGSMAFSQISNISNQDKEEEEQYYKELEEADMPPVKFVTEIGRGLRCATGLHLFNFDMIRDVKVGNHYFVIDINYFPGFAKMPSYETVLTDFFWSIVHIEDTSSEEEQKNHDNDDKMDNLDIEDDKVREIS